MNIEYYYYIYTAMTQTTGALIATVAIFIIFRIQIQRERIRNSYKSLANLASFNENYSQTKLDVLIKEELDKPQQDRRFDDRLSLIIEGEWKNAKNQEDTINYTIQEGKKVVTQAASLFIYYIFVLHIHYFIFYNLSLLRLCLFSGLVISLLIIFKIIFFLRNSIEPEKNKLTEFLSRLGINKFF